MNIYFVYQCKMSGKEILYKSGLTESEANKAWQELDSLIVNGGAGDGCAVMATTEDDPYTAQRLGIM